MSRRPALVTQADVARACRAAKALGPQWFIEIEAGTGTIRVMQAQSDRPSPVARPGAWAGMVHRNRSRDRDYPRAPNPA
jgi:hypothetical protein